jgi:hypothetical protein
MKDKKKYIRKLAQMDWDCGHPFDQYDFTVFKRLCKEDGYQMTLSDFDYYFECFDNCREAAYN